MKQNQEIIENFYKKIENKGYKARFVDAKHIPDLKNDIQQQKAYMYPKFYEEYKKYFEFIPEVDFGIIKSLIVIAVPVPQFEITFQYNSKPLSLKIPPTYLYGQKIVDDLEELSKSILNPEGYNINYGRFPVKTLAVRSGLAKYGRNNITYVSGMGSFHRLVPFYSDVPIEEDIWVEREMMDECEKCNACMNNCPTGAISNERFLLKVDRCLTYHNEQPGHVPFPEWIDRSWHNCIVGCLHCQKVCPMNKKVKNWIEKGPSFNEKETKILLQGTNFDDLPQELKNKFKEYDFMNDFETIPRNLGVFLNE
ncbi:MAG: 4Fe-4S binding protein [Candidatus Lokiarchaeota archaeon]|nr:4Fe-4S binding protein [Candidatus Lokiarchaeota archaeon]